MSDEEEADAKDDATERADTKDADADATERADTRDADEARAAPPAKRPPRTFKRRRTPAKTATDATAPADADPVVTTPAAARATTVADTRAARRALTVGGTLGALGIALVGIGPSDAGMAITLAGLIALIYGIHTFGRLGPETAQ